MPANRHLQPELFDPGPRLSAHEQDRREHARQGRELATFGEVQVSMTGRGAAGVARTGDIRTQFETETSEGANNPSWRRDVEEFMGYRDHPVYAAVARGPNEPRHYGDVVFHLDSSVKDRATMFPDDSLNVAGMAMFGDRASMEEPIRQASQADMRGISEGTQEPVVFPNWDATHGTTPYVEAHIHAGPSGTGQRGTAYARPDGDLTPTSRVPKDQIRKVTINESGSYLMNKESRDGRRPRNYEFGRDLTDAGFKVEHSLVDHVEQPALPMDYRDGPYPSVKQGTRRRLVRHEDLQGRDRWGSD